MKVYFKNSKKIIVSLFCAINIVSIAASAEVVGGDVESNPTSLLTNDKQHAGWLSSDMYRCQALCAFMVEKNYNHYVYRIIRVSSENQNKSIAFSNAVKQCTSKGYIALGKINYSRITGLVDSYSEASSFFDCTGYDKSNL